ncbi:hypothetical protein F383_34856 [Gossypium arboreum]|uniref:Uncharacterized protein n=1 Tax=Gossypium arboreum TaxID=29729 RepID=A0A0B0NB25_GOSAR|nr:hypothetical protein F383_34856 [Gossypium arboreum]
MLATLEFNLRTMVSTSPSMQMYRKPISSAIVMACRHALASAVTGSETFSHGKVQAAITKPFLLRAIIPETDIFVTWLKEASKLIFMISLSSGFHTKE